MKKKSLIILLVLSIMMSTFLIACSPSEEGATEPPVKDKLEDDSEDTVNAGKDQVVKEAKGEIIIGNTRELTGDWTPYWTNNASDNEIYHFLTDMFTVAMTPEGEYLMNESVLENNQVEENDDGSKTYTFTIKDNLKYADGSDIKALDYISSVMLWSSKVVEDSGGNSSIGYYLDGYKEFNEGSSKEFSGVKLISDTEFALTIAAEKLPYFYELDAVKSWPVKLSFWTDKNTEIKDDGSGAYFSDNFTKENFEERFNEARNKGEEFPSTGAYKLISYDKSENTLVMEVNENFPGDYKGEKPKIKRVVYKGVKAEDALSELEAGRVDLLPEMGNGDEIESGLGLVENGGIDYINYPRAGYGKLVFQTDFGPTQEVEVRQAIAHLIDRDKLTKELTGGFGSVVNGPFSESMWFYQETKSELDKALNQYSYSLESAQNLLIEAGWILDRDGNKYSEGIRYKKVDDGELMPLSIEWASIEKNPVSELLSSYLLDNEDIKKAGIDIKETPMSFDELSFYMYRDGDQDEKYASPKFGIYNLATKYTPIYDLSKTYTRDSEKIENSYNSNYIMDEELEERAKSMIRLEPEDRDSFKINFINFAIRWNQLLPELPLYSNEYYDFYNERLKNYDTNDLLKISDSILYAYLVED